MSKINVNGIEAVTTDGDLTITPNGTGILEVTNVEDDGILKLNDSQKQNKVKIKSPNDTAAQSYTLTLPSNNFVQDGYLQVSSITGSGATAVGQLEYATIAEADISNLNASNLTSGTVPSARYSGAGLSLVQRSYINTSNTISQIDFANLESDTMYKLVAPFITFGPDTNSSPSQYYTDHIRMYWIGDDGNAMVVYQGKTYNSSGGYNYYQDYNASIIDCSMASTADNQYHFEAEIYTGDATNSYIPWMYFQGQAFNLNNKAEIYATQNQNGYSARRIDQIRMTGTSRTFQEDTEIILYKYEET